MNDFNRVDYPYMAIVIDRVYGDVMFKYLNKDLNPTTYPAFRDIPKKPFEPVPSNAEKVWYLIRRGTEKEGPNSCGWHGGVYYCWP
jgi:hypothetical protein